MIRQTQIMPEEKSRSESVGNAPGRFGEGRTDDVLDIFEKAGIPDVPEKQGRPGETHLAPEKPETRQEVSHEKQIKEAAPPAASVPAGASAVPPAQASISLDADSIRKIEDAEGRVQKLIEFAIAKGVAHAISIAEHIDAYTLDRTRDRLADELSDELRKRGMIREE